MSATGVKWFTMAFMLSGGGCTPAWDGNRPLTGGADQQRSTRSGPRAATSVPSFGGWRATSSARTAPPRRRSPAPYQQVINAYGLKAIDIDIENTDEFENEVVQDRILTR